MITSGEKGTRAPSPFSCSGYRALWISNLTCNTGVLIQTVGVSWIVVAAHASPLLVALVQVAFSLPFVLISPFSGAISDSMDRREVMIGAQAVLLVVSIALASLAWTGHASPLIVITGTLLAGCSLAFNGPALMASIGDAVPREALADAVIYNAIGLNIARSVGPALGGMLVAVLGAVANFSVNAAGAFVWILVLGRWHAVDTHPVEARPAKTAEPLFAAIGVGIRYAIASPNIKAAVLRSLVFGTAFSGIQALMPLIARDLLLGGPNMYGLLSGSFGIGALVGAMICARTRKHLSAERILQLCTVASALAGFVTALSTAPWLTALCVAISGATWVVAFSIFNITVQLASARWVVARTLSLYQMAVFSGIALSSYIVGLVADYLGTAWSLLAMSGAGIGSMASGILLPIKPKSGS
jgi:MFS family permease